MAQPSDMIHVLRIIRTFNAPRELVWNAWTQREHLMHWLCPKDFTVLFAENNLQPGGAWRSGMQAPDGEQYIAGGTYQEIDAPNRLVFTHAWEKNQFETGVETLVTITLHAQGEQTEMIFEQTGFATVESRDGHDGGWSESFENLAVHLATI